MRVHKKYKIFLGHVLRVFCFSGFLLVVENIHSLGASLYVPNKSPDKLRPQIDSILQKIGSSYKENSKTEGFLYRLESKPFSRYSYNLYVSAFEEGTLLRFDSLNRTSHALADVFAAELLEKDFSRKNFSKIYKPKIYPLAILLTLIEPAFGVLYVRSKNPLTSIPPVVSFAAFLALDVVLFIFGSTISFKDITAAQIFPISLLLAHRIFHVVNLSFNITAMNKLVKLGYTFRY